VPHQGAVVKMPRACAPSGCGGICVPATGWRQTQMPIGVGPGGGTGMWQALEPLSEGGLYRGETWRGASDLVLCLAGTRADDLEGY
jgi:hypothetical protein